MLKEQNNEKEPRCMRKEETSRQSKMFSLPVESLFWGDVTDPLCWPSMALPLPHPLECDDPLAIETQWLPLELSTRGSALVTLLKQR